MNAAYVNFGRSLGYMGNSWIDVHGAGAQRSDPKSGDPADYPTGHGPQGDAIRIYNMVRCVHSGGVTETQASGSGNDRPGVTVETGDINQQQPGRPQGSGGPPPGQ